MGREGFKINGDDHLISHIGVLVGKYIHLSQPSSETPWDEASDTRLEGYNLGTTIRWRQYGNKKMHLENVLQVKEAESQIVCSIPLGTIRPGSITGTEAPEGVAC